MKKLLIPVLLLLCSIEVFSQVTLKDSLTGFEVVAEGDFKILSDKELLARFLESYKQTAVNQGLVYNEEEASELYFLRADNVFAHIELDQYNFLEGSSFPIPSSHYGDTTRILNSVKMVYDYIKQANLQSIEATGLSDSVLKEESFEIAGYEFYKAEFHVKENDMLLETRVCYVGGLSNGVILLKLRSSDEAFKAKIETAISKSTVKK